MNFTWKLFNEISFVVFALTVSCVGKKDFFSYMFITGLAVLACTLKAIDESPPKICDRKNILILTEASMYASYEVIASKRYISAPNLEIGIKALAIATPMIITAYNLHKKQTIINPKIVSYIAETINLQPRPDAEATTENINHTTVKPLTLKPIVNI